MLFKPVPRLTVDRLVQDLKASSKMLVTLLGIVMLARLVQKLNAEAPILVTLLLLAKITEVIVPSFCTQPSGIFPVFVGPT
jgi:hypothetical protein